MNEEVQFQRLLILELPNLNDKKWAGVTTLPPSFPAVRHYTYYSIESDQVRNRRVKIVYSLEVSNQNKSIANSVKYASVKW